MKHLKKYNESKIKDTMRDFLLDFTDMGFTVNQDKNISSGIKLSLEYRGEYDQNDVLNLYKELIDRLSDEYKLNDYYITMGKGGVYIEFTRESKNIFDEINMTPEQKIAFDTLSKCVSEAYGPDYVLFPERVLSSGISFNMGRPSESYKYNWMTILNTGVVNFPILRGLSRFDWQLPFTSADIKWYTRLLKLEDDFKKSSQNEYYRMADMTQKELRKKYT